MKGFLLALLVELFKWLFKPSVHTTVEGAGSGALEEKLRDRIAEAGW